MKLYTYFRSSAAYRVRIALNLKGVPHGMVPVHLLRGGGEQHSPGYHAINPAERVPSLMLDDGAILTQSLAIIDYLDSQYPEPPLYPRDPVQRAKVLAAALAIVADIHPVNNLRVLRYMKRVLGHDQAIIDAWYVHWVSEGLGIVEEMIEGGRFCFGDRPSVADLCLVPQVYNARRFNVDMALLPKVAAVEAHLLGIDAFARARPEAQAEAE